MRPAPCSAQHPHRHQRHRRHHRAVATTLATLLLWQTGAPAWAALPRAVQSLTASGNAFASITPNSGTSIDFSTYASLDQSMTLSIAQQKFSGLRSFLAERRVDFSGSSGPLDYSRQVLRYRFFASDCRELEMAFSPAGNLIYKRTSAPLNSSNTSATLRYFDDSTATAMTLPQAQQFIGSTGVQSGQSFVSSPNGGFDQVWRWQRSDKSGWIELAFDGSGNVTHLGQGKDDDINTQTDLATAFNQLQTGMTLAQVQTLLGSPGMLSYRQFPSTWNSINLSGYHWNDGSNDVGAEFQSGVLTKFKGSGLDLGGSKFAAGTFTGNELNNLSLGGTVADVKAQLGTPAKEQQGSLDYRDSEGNSLFVGFAPEYVAPPPPTTPTGSCTGTSCPTNITNTGTGSTGGSITTSTGTSSTGTGTGSTSTSSTSTSGSGSGNTTTVVNTAVAAAPVLRATTTGTITPTSTATTTGTLRAVNANLNLQCNDNPGFTLTPSSSGTLSNRILKVALDVAPADRGKTGKLYVFAVLPDSNGVLSLSQTAGWQWVTFQNNVPVVTPYADVTLGSHSLTIFDGQSDLTSASGVRIVVGYGSDVMDMIQGGKGDLAHHLRP